MVRRQRRDGNVFANALVANSAATTKPLNIMTEPSKQIQAPVRLCCGQSHTGPVCPDGKVRCCLCFERVEPEALHEVNGQKEDVCQKCAEAERTGEQL